MAIYTEQDHAAVTRQMKTRWLLLCIPLAVLLALVVYSFIIRVEVVTTACTILIGAVLIAGYDFLIKPLRCYQKHVHNALHGRRRECELPFIALSEDVNVVEGVACRALTCSDIDGKNRPYERLFYFDAQKTFPDVQPGTLLHIVNHDLQVVDVYPVHQ